nr:venom protein [Lampona murina]
MKSSFAFALLFVTVVLISTIDFSHEAEIQEFLEEARDCTKEWQLCYYKACCEGFSCRCTAGPYQHPSKRCRCKKWS